MIDAGLLTVEQTGGQTLLEFLCRQWIAMDMKLCRAPIFVSIALSLAPSPLLAEPAIKICLNKSTLLSKIEYCYAKSMTGKAGGKHQVEVCVGPNVNGGVTAVVDILTAGASAMLCDTAEISKPEEEEAAVERLKVNLVAAAKRLDRHSEGGTTFSTRIARAPMCGGRKEYTAQDFFAQFEAAKKKKSLTCEAT